MNLFLNLISLLSDILFVYASKRLICVCVKFGLFFERHNTRSVLRSWTRNWFLITGNSLKICTKQKLLRGKHMEISWYFVSSLSFIRVVYSFLTTWLVISTKWICLNSINKGISSLLTNLRELFPFGNTLKTSCFRSYTLSLRSEL